MPNIKTITKFVYKGSEYSNLQQIKDKIHNTIDERAFASFDEAKQFTNTL